MNSPEEIANKIVQYFAKDSFRLIREKQFIREFDFEGYDQVEQDRIFNEIVASAIVLSALMFETLAQKITNDESKQFFANLYIETMSEYSNILKNNGVEQHFCQIWKDLLEMRIKEYRKDYKTYRKEFEKDSNPWSQIVAIGGFQHITRGKGKAGSEAFQIFIRWIANMASFVLKTVTRNT